MENKKASYLISKGDEVFQQVYLRIQQKWSVGNIKKDLENFGIEASQSEIRSFISHIKYKCKKQGIKVY